MIARRVGAILMLGLALVFAYLFLAGFEYRGVMPWKLVTGGASVLLLVLAFVVAARKDRR
jgi:hypothetical protein